MPDHDDHYDEGHEHHRLSREEYDKFGRQCALALDPLMKGKCGHDILDVLSTILARLAVHWGVPKDNFLEKAAEVYDIAMRDSHEGVGHA